MQEKELVRCPWSNGELYNAYHDQEWGVPVHDDRHLFEMINLEGAQAGLSWITILKKRDNYRAAFDNFDVHRIVCYKEKKLTDLMADAGIVRNRLKIAAVVANANACLAVQKEFGSLDAYLWQFVNHTPLQNHRTGMGDIPAKSAESDAMSKDMLKRGFKFVGSTICYAFMQAVGMVNDHIITCHRYAPLAGSKKVQASPKRAKIKP